MNAKPILIAAALGASLLAGCNQGPEKSGALPAAPLPAAVQGSQTPATAAERKDGGAPVQGQVDTKEPVQRKAFEAPRG
jgi:hypothetical protein